MYLMRDKNTAVKATSLEAWLREWKDKNDNTIGALTAYQLVPWVRRPVDLIAGGVSTMPFGIYRGEERVAGDQDYQALDLPHTVNMRTLLKGLTVDLLLYGYAHWAVTGLEGYQRVQRLAARHFTYKTDTGDAVYWFEYRRGTYYRYASRWQDMSDNGLPYVWEEAENDEKPGSARVVAALKSAGVLNSMADYGKFFFDGGGAGPVIFQFEGFEHTPESERERVQSWLDRFVTGAKNAFRPLAMGGNVQVHQVGHSVRELAMPELSREKREDVLAALGIPASLVLSNAANFATAQVDKLNFLDYTVVPTFDQISDALNSRWLRQYDLELRAEPQRLQVYQNAELERVDKLLPQLQVGAITLDEFREETGREKLTTPPEEPLVIDEPEPTREARAVERLASPAGEDALRKWRVKAVKRWHEGTPEKGREFESDAINAATKAAVIGALEAAQSVEDIEAAFDGAAVWVGYG